MLLARTLRTRESTGDRRMLALSCALIALPGLRSVSKAQSIAYWSTGMHSQNPSFSTRFRR